MRLKGSMPQMKALILAGGKGKRLGSDITHIPKVMREANGKPLLGYVMEYTDFIDKKDKVILVGYEKEKVISAFPEYPFAVQEVQKGTGHAVMCAKECFEGYEGEVLVINGDMPLLRRESVLELIEAHKENGNLCTILSFIEKGEIPPFGHITRDENGKVSGIVEHKDATEEQKLIRELNGGIYVFNSAALFNALDEITPSPVTGEYYLTDVPKLMISKGMAVDTYILADQAELAGVNTEEDLKEVEKILLERA
jgi:bifunctional UDP-N-acetylglucosamine pyrophosphorylase/glucosamine-1-phosphate N-acetyltransferase/UDP-N-acetylglucosamine pyrophosphorylase